MMISEQLANLRATLAQLQQGDAGENSDPHAANGPGN